MFQNILAAVDQSDRAAGVVEAAIAIADRFAGQVNLYTALAIPPEFPPAASTQGDALLPYLIEQARARLATLASGRSRVRTEPPAVLHSQPWRDILAAAQRLGADLIVIGSHGYGGWDRVLGTTAGKVANHAACPVLIIHERAPRRTKSRSSPRDAEG